MSLEKIYVAGKFVESSKPIDIVSPFSGDIVYNTFQATEKEFEESTQASLAVQKEMQNLPSYKRYEILRQISDELLKNKEKVATVMAREAAKPMKFALTEVDRAVQTFLTAAEESKRLPSEFVSIDWAEAGRGKEAVIKYFPIGSVAAIAPFNFPLNLVAHKVAPAIAAGCPIVLKPASQTPITSLELAKIIDKTDLPKGAFSVIPMDRETGNKLVTDNRYKLLSFTGSPGVGWKMKEQAGKKKTVLELGGNAGLIVTESANLNKAVNKAIVGAFAYSGQSCIHTQRIYVHSSIFEDFLSSFATKTESLKYGDPQDPEVDISAMIDEKNAIRIEEWVNQAVENGAKIITGGRRNKTFYEATVLTDVDPKMQVCFDEAFAPVVIIEKYNDFAEAIKKVNDSEFGLQAGIFTNNYREINQAWNNLEVGGVTINEVPTFRMDHMPYGGLKDSGIGREGPKYAMMDMLEPRILVLDNNFEE